MCASPPAADGHVDAGEDHAEVAVVVEQVVVVIASADGDIRHVLGNLHLALQLGSLDILLKELIFGEQPHPRPLSKGRGE